MKDRIPKYPNRKKLTRADGTVETVYLENYDEPLQEGTPLNTANIMSDKVAKLFGLPVPDSTPSQALDKLSDFVETVVNPGFETEPMMPYMPTVDKVVYLDDSGSNANSGLVETAPVRTLDSALTLLGTNGGTIRIVNKFTVSDYAKYHSGALLYEGVTESSRIIFGKGFSCHGDTAFRRITLECAADYVFLNASGYRLGMLDGITTRNSGTATVGLGIRGGSDSFYVSGNTHIAVFSGRYNSVHGGTRNASVTGNSVVAVFGGSIKTLSGSNDNSEGVTDGIAGKRVVIINGTGAEIDNVKNYDMLINSGEGGYVNADLVLYGGEGTYSIGASYKNADKITPVNGTYTLDHSFKIGYMEDDMPRNRLLYAYGKVPAQTIVYMAPSIVGRPPVKYTIKQNYKVTLCGGYLDIPESAQYRDCKKIEYRIEYAASNEGGANYCKVTAIPLDGKKGETGKGIVTVSCGLGRESDGVSLSKATYSDIADVNVGDTVCDAGTGYIFEVNEVTASTVRLTLRYRLPNEKWFVASLAGMNYSTGFDVDGTEFDNIEIGDYVFDTSTGNILSCSAIAKDSDGKRYAQLVFVHNVLNLTLKGYKRRQYTPLVPSDTILTAFAKLEGRVTELTNKLFSLNNSLTYMFSPDVSETFTPQFSGTYKIWAVGAGGDGYTDKNVSHGGGGGGVGLLSSYTLTKGETYTITKTANGITLADSTGSTIISATNGTNATSSAVGTGGSASGVTGVTVYAGTAGNGMNGGGVSQDLATNEYYVPARINDWYYERTISYKGGAGIFGEKAALPGYVGCYGSGSSLGSGFQEYWYSYYYVVKAPQEAPEGAGIGGSCNVKSIASRSFKNTSTKTANEQALEVCELLSGGIGGSGYGGGASGGAQKSTTRWGNAGKGARACIRIESVLLEAEGA